MSGTHRIRKVGKTCGRDGDRGRLLIRNFKQQLEIDWRRSKRADCLHYLDDYYLHQWPNVKGSRPGVPLASVLYERSEEEVQGGTIWAAVRRPNAVDSFHFYTVERLSGDSGHNIDR